MSYLLPTLTYAYDKLEPYFDKETMEIHHTKHHQTYINNANTILEIYPYLAEQPVEELIKDLNKVPDTKRTFMRNNAGGHANHSIFWQGLKIGTILAGNLKRAIEINFGTIKEFQTKFEIAAVTCFGSGWTWLVSKDNKLAVVSTANQDNPLMGETIMGVSAGYPIIALDVWEHAYYLKYQNRRLDYVKAFWNVVDWDIANKRYNNRPF
ncbi:Fe-Mn family superoxide dismutase [Candidatus Fukatsuia anoeciicola]|uniref:Fe-Mn family superoxide dismutase n=1 Tax=Candidatus Fukatsuia anoeciicola TaxID=2994492 RepID=UPI0034646DEA